MITLTWVYATLQCEDYPGTEAEALVIAAKYQRPDLMECASQQFHIAKWKSTLMILAAKNHQEQDYENIANLDSENDQHIYEKFLYGFAGNPQYAEDFLAAAQATPEIAIKVLRDLRRYHPHPRYIDSLALQFVKQNPEYAATTMEHVYGKRYTPKDGSNSSEQFVDHDLESWETNEGNTSEFGDENRTSDSGSAPVNTIEGGSDAESWEDNEEHSSQESGHSEHKGGHSGHENGNAYGKEYSYRQSHKSIK